MKFYLIAWCFTPLGIAGFVLVAATISTTLGQTFIPQGTYHSLPAWTSSNALCIELAAFTPLPYVVLAMKIQPKSTFLSF